MLADPILLVVLLLLREFCRKFKPSLLNLLLGTKKLLVIEINFEFRQCDTRNALLSLALFWVASDLIDLGGKAEIPCCEIACHITKGGRIPVMGISGRRGLVRLSANYF